MMGRTRSVFEGLLLASALLVGLWARPVRAQFFSPGDLASDHAALEGDDRCADCHSAGSRVDDGKCKGCHEDVAATVRKRSGLHGRNYAAKSCGSCHVDHRGRSHSLVRWDPEAFDHALSGHVLRGRHAELDCRRCHDQRNRRGHPTYLGLSPTCGSCHQDPHEGRFGASCSDCHDERRWGNVDLNQFDHGRSRFPLRGKHEAVPCPKCHGDPPKYQPQAFQSCGSCHEDPHRSRLGGDCASCHSEASWKQVPRSRHPGTSLGGGHARVPCKTCHDRGNLAEPSRGSRCVSCHAPVHLARFGNDCASCHANVRWLGVPQAIGRRVHGRTRYPLLGKHQKVRCTACHDKSVPVARRYRNLDFDACGDCHQDEHKGQFVDRQGGECGPCHDTGGFAPTTFGLALHATTDFPLSGGHEAAPCRSCHAGRAPRLDWQSGKRACAECHENPHGNQFEKEMRAGGCAACHKPVGWDSPNVDHDIWPLTGKHATARCDQCHVETDEQRASGGTVSYRGAPRECAACHADVHLGQFRLTEPRRECDECHQTDRFEIPDFDHAQKTRYPLEGKHRELECVRCHQKQTLGDGRAAVLYRLPFDECRDCHANPHPGGR